MRFVCFLFVVSSFLSSCNSLKFYEDNRPVLNITEYLCGRLEGYGMFFDYRDRGTIRFKVETEGICSTGGIVKVRENILFEDGSIESRVREVSILNVNKLSISGNSIIDSGDSEQYGNAARLSYDQKVRKGLNAIDVSVEESWFLIDNEQAITKVKVKKALIVIGEIVIFWKKTSSAISELENVVAKVKKQI